MIADILKQKKEEKGITTEELSRLSGVPVGTINKILNGETKSPRYNTLSALEKVLMDKMNPDELWVIRDSGAAIPSEASGPYTVQDYYNLPEETRAELIDGEFFFMSAPSTVHQILVMKIASLLDLYVIENKGECIVLPSPIDVQLDCDEKTMVQPDIIVVCDKEKLVPKGVYGAPDMVVEITSASTRKRDFSGKMSKYMDAGVREYWIVDLQKQKVITYYFEEDVIPSLYTFHDKIPVQIFGGKQEIDFAEFSRILERIPVE